MGAPEINPASRNFDMQSQQVTAGRKDMGGAKALGTLTSQTDKSTGTNKMASAQRASGPSAKQANDDFLSAVDEAHQNKSTENEKDGEPKSLGERKSTLSKVQVHDAEKGQRKEQKSEWEFRAQALCQRLIGMSKDALKGQQQGLLAIFTSNKGARKGELKKEMREYLKHLVGAPGARMDIMKFHAETMDPSILSKLTPKEKEAFKEILAEAAKDEYEEVKPQLMRQDKADKALTESFESLASVLTDPKKRSDLMVKLTQHPNQPWKFEEALKKIGAFVPHDGPKSEAKNARRRSALAAFMCAEAGAGLKNITRGPMRPAEYLLIKAKDSAVCFNMVDRTMESLFKSQVARLLPKIPAKV